MVVQTKKPLSSLEDDEEEEDEDEEENSEPEEEDDEDESGEDEDDESGEENEEDEEEEQEAEAEQVDGEDDDNDEAGDFQVIGKNNDKSVYATAAARQSPPTKLPYQSTSKCLNVCLLYFRNFNYNNKNHKESNNLHTSSS